MSEELSREEMEEQLRSGEPEEEPDAELESEDETQEPSEPPDYEALARDLQERLAKLEEDSAGKAAALAEERDRRRTSEYQFNELLQQIRQASESQRQPVDVPDPEEDEIGYLRHQVDQMAHLLSEMRQSGQQQQQLGHQHRQQQQFVQAYMADIGQFTQKNPDFQDAAKHLYESRKQELNAMGYNNPAAVHEAIIAEEMAIVQQTFANRQSPAERLYTLAKMRGYQPGKPDASRSQSPPKPPKSLGNIPGASGALPDNFDGKVNKVVQASMHDDLMKLDPKELEKLLRQYNP